MSKQIIDGLKLMLLTALIFIFDVFARNLFTPFLLGMPIVYPMVPLDFLWVYALGAFLFHFVVTYFSIRRFYFRFLLGCGIYLVSNLMFIVRERDFAREWWMMVSASLMVGVMIVLLHILLFRRPVLNK